MHYDLIFKNGNVVSPDSTQVSDIAVSGGKIIKIEKLDSGDTADEVYDAKGKYILPGVIDAHVHFRDPGLTEKEDFETGSIAAAMGGITMAADMPNTVPVTSTLKTFNEKLKIANEKSYIDFGLYALLNNDNLEEMQNLKDAGAFGFKIFLGTSTGDIAAPSPSVLFRQMEFCAAELGLRIAFHCETSEINTYFTSLFKDDKNMQDGYKLTRSRPVFSEALGVQTVVCYAQYTGAKIHILHITSRETAYLTAEAKKKNANITAETCPHYLLFNCEDNAFKVYPPIRSEKCRNALWDSLKNGTIDMIASDHAPHTIKEKSLPVSETPAGLSGVETSVPLMLNEVNKGKLTLNEYVRLSSEAPAKIWGIYPQKGSLLPGTDADFTIVDMDLKKTINANELHSKSKTNPYDGTKVQGFPIATIVRGMFVMRNGSLCGKKGSGVLVSPEL